MRLVAQLELGLVDTANGQCRVLIAKDEHGRDWVLLHAETEGAHAVELLRPDDARALGDLLSRAVESPAVLMKAVPAV